MFISPTGHGAALTTNQSVACVELLSWNVEFRGEHSYFATCVRTAGLGRVISLLPGPSLGADTLRALGASHSPICLQSPGVFPSLLPGCGACPGARGRGLTADSTACEFPSMVPSMFASSHIVLRNKQNQTHSSGAVALGKQDRRL